MISVSGLTSTYRLGRETIPALDGVDLSIEEEHASVLLGPSGCGKKTLLLCLASRKQHHHIRRRTVERGQ